jgi:hypothetical protein
VKARDATYQEVMAKAPVRITEYDEEEKGKVYSLAFEPDEIPALAKAIKKAGFVANGYVVESVMMYLSEKDDPTWAADLRFNSETDCFHVVCDRKAPLVFLLRRLEKRLANPAALRRLLRADRLSEFKE